MQVKSNIEVNNDLEDSLKKSDDYVSDMLRFYQDGWDERGKSDQKNFISKIKAKLDMTLNYIDDVNSALNEQGLTLISSHVKLKNPNSLSVLFVISLEDYLSEKLLGIYPISHDIEKKSRSEEYGVTFSFTYDEGNFDMEAVKAHGFVTTFSNVEKATRQS
jgi:hypothetical protein